MLSPLRPLFGAALLLPIMASAQQIMLLPINAELQFGQPIQVSQSEGYNNQPAFSSDSSQLFYSSNNGGESMDIMAYHLSDGLLTNRTNTPDENEFSPQSGDSNDELVYVVEQGVPDQSVWRQRQGKPRSRAVRSFIDSGYYARNADVGTLLWARYGHHLYFEPNGEQADERHFVAASVGRSIHAIPASNQFSFVHKQINADWVIKRYQPSTGAITPLISIDQQSEDYTWRDGNTIWKGRGSVLLQWQQGEQQWQQIADLKPLGINTIGRLDVSPNGKWLALVDLDR
ncbi:hypothetical protein [uncultured Ferrimonas sp.]|uniref:TolB family protein n=1 Tax=uncultured Ferrimonas sp. TaxID=432640 RepID=UPI002608B6E6|nr:hypothetical protein [uncultured Ferrimonas sp.]